MSLPPASTVITLKPPGVAGRRHTITFHEPSGCRFGFSKSALSIHVSFVVTAALAMARTLASSRAPLPVAVEVVLEVGAHPIAISDRRMSEKKRMTCRVV